MVNIFQQKDKATKHFDLRYCFLIIFRGWWWQKISLCWFGGVDSWRQYNQGAYIYWQCRGVYIFNNILIYMQLGRANIECQL